MGDASKSGSQSNNGAITVREMEIDDLAPVFHLGEQLFTSDRYPFLYRTWEEYEVTGMFNTDPDYCLIAEDDDSEEMAGFILGTIITKASWTYGYIIWLGVNPRFQRRGVADKLVDKVVERMVEEGVRYMLVDTDPRNTPAVKFFQGKGFGAPRDHVVFSMNLEKHDRYGRLIKRERARERAEKEHRQKERSVRRSRVIHPGESTVSIRDPGPMVAADDVISVPPRVGKGHKRSSPARKAPQVRESGGSGGGEG